MKYFETILNDFERFIFENEISKLSRNYENLQLSTFS